MIPTTDTLSNDVMIDPLTGDEIPVIRTAAGIGILYELDSDDKARIAAGQPLLIFFPRQQFSPAMIPQTLVDPGDDPGRGFLPETNLKLIDLYGIPGFVASVVTSFDRILYDGIWYCYIDGDPTTQFQDARQWLLGTIGDYAQYLLDRQAVFDWADAVEQTRDQGMIPPDIVAFTGLTLAKATVHYLMNYAGILIPNPGP